MEHVKKPIDWFINQAHSLAIEKGWWERSRSFHECIALIDEEIGEAVTALRTNAKSDKIVHMSGIQEECADIAIRILDLCGCFVGIDLGAELAKFMPNYVNLDGDDMELAFIHLMDEIQENEKVLTEQMGFMIDRGQADMTTLPIERLARVGLLVGQALYTGVYHLTSILHTAGMYLAAAIIEIAGLLYNHDGDCYLGCAIIAKHEYNKSRPHRHGGKLH